MPDHAMTMPLVPAWSVAIAVVVLLAAGALHVSHARAALRWARWWHAAHVAMAAGMIVMFLVPAPSSAGLYWALAVVFGAVAIAMALAFRRVSGVDRRVWSASMVDQALMVYMLLPLVGRPAALTYPAVAYLVAAAAAWLVVPERFTCMTPQRGIPPRDRPAPSDVALVGARSGALLVSSGTVALVDRATARPAVAQRLSVRLASNLTTGVRLTLMVMALAMAWMLLAMQVMDGAAP